MADEKEPERRERPNAGPKVLPIPSHTDDRGRLRQVLGSYPDEFPGVERAYVVGNFGKGTIRGFHMHRAEWKAYHVLRGAAKFIVVSESSDERQSFVLSESEALVLVVPPTYYHGWVSLTDDTLLVGLSNRSLKESEADDYRIDPMKFGPGIWEVKAR